MFKTTPLWAPVSSASKVFEAIPLDSEPELLADASASSPDASLFLRKLPP
jgi:hypothetical protein